MDKHRETPPSPALRAQVILGHCQAIQAIAADIIAHLPQALADCEPQHAIWQFESELRAVAVRAREIERERKALLAGYHGPNRRASRTEPPAP